MLSRLVNSRISGVGHERWSERAAMLVTLLLALTLVWMLARTFWLLVPRDAGGAKQPAQVSVAAGANPAISIAKWHLFGNAPQQRAALRNAPATTLQLSLRGTLADADPHRGIAVIADAQGNDRAWRAGEELSIGVKLEEVHADRVVLLHDGVQEVLTLVRDEPAQRVAPIPIGTRPGDPPRNTAASPAGGTVTSFVPPILPQGSLNWQQTMEKIGADPAQAARDVRINPVIDDGHIVGVRVSAASGDAALLGRLGLRPSDIVTAVNGVPVDSLERGQQILESLRSANSVRVTVTRDGRPAEVTVQLR
jgi:general secretion pathway protein C